ncbi:CDF family Co(II)/Ni(II) efflux transporter DmeF [Agrobacterium rubi]|uniref:CDF family Co(II)/Ni(II) efflux transporter DmeF n=1 Tax=Agrobacterium rubi TaxID=28099 RepID=A0AAE7RBL6_9HYPH|nr:CDF family Co(II)/Ni(II) efflux transporter DmeF [Agrobacterium rubi]NTE85716.1 CDF family Co(II)/Ni(II) efflux transporter DmeF [Agrobacterium rubi]NTF01648.1 CDF family Co(II)/Ni(II) efflux transporter DmeF [Agrobacterium rubi]NTF35891.1 CDF family Co(II)/Ni(II) efflux transporter DmeF [Agrobacterium rubi]OCJ48225.1 cation transporter [Agrobacterium rubi]QTG00994.1 CDF family Co(II)/Ni(II) efflux transporter DmeF [Agrobacterium rubi]
MTAATDHFHPHPHPHGAHSHVFLGDNHERNERRVWAVIGLTTAMMVAEIAAGSWFGSMALTADGWHMATHAGAMLISALAYLYARRQVANNRFTFGTGKFGDLAGFASAVVLGVAALMIAWESLLRFFSPVDIDFNQAIAVAAIGLVVNIVSAWLLKDDHHHHDHDHSHAHGSHAHHGDHAHHDHHGSKDNNLRSAYLHVLADALTSVLAIVALLLGKWNGWTLLDPAMGIVGGIVIARWSWGLLRSTGAVLVDAVPQAQGLSSQIRSRLETPEEKITDLHVWQVGPGHHAAIVSIKSPSPQAPSFYRKKLEAITELSHITVEINAAHGA